MKLIKQIYAAVTGEQRKHEEGLRRELTKERKRRQAAELALEEFKLRHGVGSIKP